MLTVIIFALPLSSNYASVHHVPSLDSISTVMDGLHLQVQEAGQVVLSVLAYKQKHLHSFQMVSKDIFISMAKYLMDPTSVCCANLGTATL